MKDPTFWILARASGLTAYVLLTATVLLGLVVRSRPLARLRPAAVTDVHRFLAVHALGAVVLHGVALVLDSTVHGLAAGSDSSRPWATALYTGAIAVVAAAAAWRALVPRSSPIPARGGVR